MDRAGGRTGRVDLRSCRRLPRPAGVGRRPLRLASVVRHVADSRPPGGAAARGAHPPGADRPARRRRGERHRRGRGDAHRNLRRSSQGRPADLLPDRWADRGPLRQGDGAARLDRPRGELRHRPGPPGRCPRRQRGEAEGQRSRLRPDREHPPHAALGPRVREPRRGPVSDLADGGPLHPLAAAPGGDRRRQALRRQQPGGPAGRQRDDRQPLHGRCRGRRADAARDLPARLRGRRQGRRRRLGDVLIQPPERAARLREPAAPERHPAPRLGVQGPGAGRLRGVEDGRRRARCGTRLRAVAVRRFRRRRELHAGRDRAGARGRRDRPGGHRPRRPPHPPHPVRLRVLRPRGLRTRRAGDRQDRPSAHVPATRRARGGAAAEPRRRPAAHRPATRLARGDRRRLGALRERRRLLEHRPVRASRASATG